MTGGFTCGGRRSAYTTYEAVGYYITVIVFLQIHSLGYFSVCQRKQADLKSVNETDSLC